MCTQNVLEKLRQDNDEGVGEVINVEPLAFSSTGIGEKIAEILDLHGILTPYFRTMERACLSHAENCIENTAIPGNSIWDAWM